MPSAIFKINGQTAGVAQDITENSTVYLELYDKKGIDVVSWEIFGTSENTEIPIITKYGAPPGSLAKFDIGSVGTGKSYGIRCIVNNGVNAAGVADDNLISTSAVYILNQNNIRPLFTGESYEGDPIWGWVGRLNTVLATPAIIAGKTATLNDVLKNGNTTDGYDIEFTGTDSIVFDSATISPNASTGLIIKSDNTSSNINVSDSLISINNTTAITNNVGTNVIALTPTLFNVNIGGQTITFNSERMNVSNCIKTDGYIQSKTGYIISPSASAPITGSAASTVIWARSSDDRLVYTDLNNVTRPIVQGIYDVLSVNNKAQDGYICFGTNYAQTGSAIRGASNFSIYTRNAANTGNISLYDRSSDLQLFGDNNYQTYYYGNPVVIQGYTSAVKVDGNVSEITINPLYSSTQYGFSKFGVGYLEINQSDAASGSAQDGIIRLPNNQSIKARNSTNLADVSLLSLSSTNNTTVGDGYYGTIIVGSVLNLAINTTTKTSITSTNTIINNTTVDLQSGGTSKFNVNGTGIGFFGATPAAKITVTGSRASGAALASLLSQLAANYGFIIDNSSA